MAAGGKDACQGDSGGPLVTRATGVDTGYSLVGIVSFGCESLAWVNILPKNPYLAKRGFLENLILLNTPLLNGPINKNCDQRSGILHIVRDP